jgi:hypothetical protein
MALLLVTELRRGGDARLRGLVVRFALPFRCCHRHPIDQLCFPEALRCERAAETLGGAIRTIDAGPRARVCRCCLAIHHWSCPSSERNDPQPASNNHVLRLTPTTFVDTGEETFRCDIGRPHLAGLAAAQFSTGKSLRGCKIISPRHARSAEGGAPR